jgi:hypothetical protein
MTYPQTHQTYEEIRSSDTEEMLKAHFTCTVKVSRISGIPQNIETVISEVVTPCFKRLIHWFQTGITRLDAFDELIPKRWNLTVE